MAADFMKVASCIAAMTLKQTCFSGVEKLFCDSLCCCDNHNTIKGKSTGNNLKGMCMDVMLEAQGARSQGIFSQVPIDLRGTGKFLGNWKELQPFMTRLYDGFKLMTQGKGVFTSKGYTKGTLGIPDVIVLHKDGNGNFPSNPQKGDFDVWEWKFDDLDKPGNEEQMDRYRKVDPNARKIDRRTCKCDDYNDDGTTVTEASKKLAADAEKALVGLMGYSTGEGILTELNPLPAFPHVPAYLQDVIDEADFYSRDDLGAVWEMLIDKDPAIPSGARLLIDIWRLRKMRVPKRMPKIQIPGPTLYPAGG